MPSYDHYAKDHLIVEISDQVALVTLNRPEKGNAVNTALHLGIEHVLVELSKDSEVGAIVLTGAGKTFCAGGDVDIMGERDLYGIAEILNKPKDLVQAFLDCDVPVIAAVNGAAAGVGATIALLCDMILMSESAKIGDNHVKVGLVAGDGGSLLWPALVGPHVAKEFLLTGDWVDAPRAKEIGLVNRVLPADKLLEEALVLARRIVSNPRWAVRFTKRAVNRTVWQNWNMALETSLALESLTMYSEDHQEAIAAFTEKRKPKFKGR